MNVYGQIHYSHFNCNAAYRQFYSYFYVSCPVGLFLPAVFLAAVGFSGCSGVLAVTFLTLSSAFGGFSAAGVFINQIDIAPRYKNKTA